MEENESFEQLEQNFCSINDAFQQSAASAINKACHLPQLAEFWRIQDITIQSDFDKIIEGLD